MDAFSKKTGDAVRALAKARGMSLSDVARGIGIEPSAIFHKLSGKFTVFTPEDIARLMALFGVTRQEIHGNPAPKPEYEPEGI